MNAYQFYHKNIFSLSKFPFFHNLFVILDGEKVLTIVDFVIRIRKNDFIASAALNNRQANPKQAFLLIVSRKIKINSVFQNRN